MPQAFWKVAHSGTFLDTLANSNLLAIITMQLMQSRIIALRLASALFASLALLSAHAQLPSTEDAADEAETFALPAGMGNAAFGNPPMGVRKMTDGDLSCQQLFTEAEGLEKTLAEQKTAVASAQQSADDTRNAMMEQAMGGGGIQATSMASGLLSMIPGVGMAAGLVSGAASQAATSARMAGIQESTKRMMETQQKAIEMQQSMYYSQARHDHLVELFLKKDCKVSQLKAATPKPAGQQ
jgi:hypothetical protein